MSVGPLEPVLVVESEFELDARVASVGSLRVVSLQSVLSPDGVLVLDQAVLRHPLVLAFHPFPYLESRCLFQAYVSFRSMQVNEHRVWRGPGPSASMLVLDLRWIASTSVAFLHECRSVEGLRIPVLDCVVHSLNCRSHLEFGRRSHHASWFQPFHGRSPSSLKDC